MSADSYHMPEQCQLFCPSCQVDLTFSKVEAGDTRPPKAGDHTVCCQCLIYLKYVEPEAGALRLDAISRDEFEALGEQYQIPLMRVRGELLAARQERQAIQPTRFEAALALEVTALKERVRALEDLFGIQSQREEGHEEEGNRTHG